MTMELINNCGGFLVIYDEFADSESSFYECTVFNVYKSYMCMQGYTGAAVEEDCETVE